MMSIPQREGISAPVASGVVVQAVSKSFGETRALNGCSFEARLGQIHAIVGENGSGKSTLAKILSGVLMPDQGSVSILGQTPRSPREARRLGIATIFQEVLVADEASVADNLFVGADGWLGRSRPAEEKRRIARNLMQRLAQADVDPDALVGSLPLAIKQWIVIARALLTEPKVLILDESSAALDLEATNRLHDEMRRLRDAGSCIIIVTHRIAELVRIADRATILRDGRVAGEFAKADINERNLLAMMTPPSRHLPVAQACAKVGRGPISASLLVAEGIRVHIGAPAFDFSLGSGEIVGVSGLDGQGQDRFVRVLSGIGQPFGGRVTCSEESGGSLVDSLAKAEAFGITYVSGDRKREGIFPNLSIYENLAMALYRTSSGALGWIHQAPIRDAYGREVRRLSIKAGSPSHRITSLSGGNQQKVLIGRAFAKKPKVIVLNDPARGVDLGTKRELYDELRRYVAEGGAVVYLSSEIEEFLGFADRVAVFHKGTLSRTLTGNEIKEDAMLAAMFGHATPVHFDESAEALA